MRLRLTAARYVHKSAEGKQFLTAGDVLECDSDAAARLLSLGAAVDVDAEADAEDEQETPEGKDVEAATTGQGEEPQKVEVERPKNAANLAAWQDYARALGQDPGKRTKEQLMSELP